MPTIPVFLPDDLHKQFRLFLYQDDRTAKEFFLTSVEVYVKSHKSEPAKKVEEHENPDDDIKVHTVSDVTEPEDKNKKSKGKIEDEKKRQTTGKNNEGTKGGDRGQRSPEFQGQKNARESGESGEQRTGRKRGLWPWSR